MPTTSAPAAAGATRWKRSASTMKQIYILTCRKRSAEAILQLILVVKSIEEQESEVRGMKLVMSRVLCKLA